MEVYPVATLEASLRTSPEIEVDVTPTMLNAFWFDPALTIVEAPAPEIEMEVVAYAVLLTVNALYEPAANDNVSPERNVVDTVSGEVASTVE